MSTDAEKLAQIAALCDDAEHNATRWHDPLPVPEWVPRVRAILAEPVPAVEPDSIYQLAEYDPDDGSVVRAWVREAPAPLPTEAYTVIRVTAPTMQKRLVCVLHEDGKWWDIRGVAQRDLSTITGFEVLAEPTPRVALYQEQQRVARDVLNDIASEPWAREVDLTKWRRKYGVSS